jgi:hypothetical protein
MTKYCYNTYIFLFPTIRMSFSRIKENNVAFSGGCYGLKATLFFFILLNDILMVGNRNIYVL